MINIEKNIQKIRMIVFVICLFLLTGCTNKVVSLEQFQNNVIQYEKWLDLVVGEYEIQKILDENIVGDISQYNYVIVINDSACINISVEYCGIDSSSGREEFYISYNVSKTSKVRIDDELELFVNLVNMFSSKKITMQMCEEIINDSSDKYSMRKEDMDYEELLLGKQYYLDFFENWLIEYRVDKEGNENLSFYGKMD